MQVKGKPSTVSFIAKDITPKTAVVEAIVNPSGYASNVFVEYWQTFGNNITIPMEQNPVSGTNEVTVSGLISNLLTGTPYSYRVLAVNEAGADTSDIKSFVTVQYPDNYSLSQTINLPTKPSIEDYRTSDYRIIGLPGSSNALINEFLDGELDKDWIVYWDNGAADDFYVKFDGSDRFKCTVGKGFFVLSKNKPYIQRDVPTVPINEFAQAEIPLHEGWNLITNPFTSPVLWSAVREANENMDAPLYSFSAVITARLAWSPIKDIIFTVRQV